jgi:hypothetical protein
LRNQQETKILEGYNLINWAKLWYQMMRTSWSCGHATQPICKDTNSRKSQVNQVW